MTRTRVRGHAEALALLWLAVVSTVTPTRAGRLDWPSWKRAIQVPAASAPDRAPVRLTPAPDPVAAIRQRRERRLASWLVLTTLAAAWLLLLRPQSLGGPAVYMIVRGDSMLPTYSHGDLVLLTAQPAYLVGDPVAYRVPDGEIGAGKLVLHRITGISDEGYIMRGDNNPSADPWHPSEDLIAGRVVLAVPKAGQLISMAFQPAAAGALATALMVMLLIGRGGPARGADRVGPALRRLALGP